jgi:hypothetical protein
MAANQIANGIENKNQQFRRHPIHTQDPDPTFPFPRRRVLHASPLIGL